MSARSTGPRGEYAKTPMQRQRILDAAMVVFAQRGNRGASLREIAEQVNMSQAGLLHHFGSKDDLLLAVLERADAEEQPESPIRSVVEGVDYVRSGLARDMTRPGIFRLHATLSAEATEPDHPAHEHFVAHYRRIRDQFGEAITTAIASGELRSDIEPAALSSLIMAAWDGLQLQKLLDPKVDVLAAIDMLFESLLTTYVTALPEQNA